MTWPFLLICLASGFGLVGSILANKREKVNKKFYVVALGPTTGLTLYWFALFFSSALIPVTVVLNPISAVVIGVCGGFAGLEVIRFILKRFFAITV